MVLRLMERAGGKAKHKTSSGKVLLPQIMLAEKQFAPSLDSLSSARKPRVRDSNQRVDMAGRLVVCQRFVVLAFCDMSFADVGVPDGGELLGLITDKMF